MTKQKTTNVKPAKVKKKKVDNKDTIAKAIDSLKYIPSQRNWEEFLKRANYDEKLAMRIAKATLFWIIERRKL
jgi:hypothetical protein